MRRGLWFVAGAVPHLRHGPRTPRRRGAHRRRAQGPAQRSRVGARLFRDEVAQGRLDKETELRERYGSRLMGGPSSSGRHRAAAAPGTPEPTALAALTARPTAPQHRRGRHPLMDTAEIRRRFVAHFERHGHRAVPSASLLLDDPNLLFVNAGMVPFKYLLGQETPPYDRAVSVEVRADPGHRGRRQDDPARHVLRDVRQPPSVTTSRRVPSSASGTSSPSHGTRAAGGSRRAGSGRACASTTPRRWPSG